MPKKRRARSNTDQRGRNTIYVTGFNPRLTTKTLLTELFSQGGPVADVTLFSTHAYVLFQDEESVAYCLALFNGIELHGRRLNLSPRAQDKDTYKFLDYLTRVRNKIRDDYMKIDPPQMPAKVYSNDAAQRVHSRTSPRIPKSTTPQRRRRGIGSQNSKVKSTRGNLKKHLKTSRLVRRTSGSEKRNKVSR